MMRSSFRFTVPARECSGMNSVGLFTCAFTDPHPHLTVGSQLDDATADTLERSITPGLPVASRVDQLTLLVEDDEGRWTVSRAWPLARSTSAVVG